MNVYDRFITKFVTFTKNINVSSLPNQQLSKRFQGGKTEFSRLHCLISPHSWYPSRRIAMIPNNHFQINA